MQITEVQYAISFQVLWKAFEFCSHVPNHRSECIVKTPLVLPYQFQKSLQGCSQATVIQDLEIAPPALVASRAESILKKMAALKAQFAVGGRFANACQNRA